MRELKFRGFDPVKKEFRFADICETDEMSEWITWDKPFGGGTNTGVGFDIQQFTGLTDKNGVDIYEGDVIAFGEDDIKNPRVGMYGEVGVVEFCDNGARFVVELSQTERRVPLSDHKLFSDGHTCRLVIGNIHQHPELLK